MRVSRGGTLSVELKGSAADTSGTGPIDGRVIGYADVGGDALEGVFIGSPFDEG
jgi:hypothetical protein